MVRPWTDFMPLPSRPAGQGEWALPVGLVGGQIRFHGQRCLVGLVGRLNEPPPLRRAYWVSFEPDEPTFPPEVVLIPEENLVALPTPSVGASLTPWEAERLADAEGDPEENLALVDEASLERQLALRSGPEDDDGGESDASYDLGEDEETEDDAPEIGALVEVPMASEGSRRFGRVQRLEGGGRRAVVRLLEPPGEIADLAVAELRPGSADALTLAATCHTCGAAEPEAELLLCDHFSETCMRAAHIGCLCPPLEAIPDGPWLCSACAHPAAPSGPGHTHVPNGTAVAKGKAKAGAAKAKAKASAVSKGLATGATKAAAKADAAKRRRTA